MSTLPPEDSPPYRRLILPPPVARQGSDEAEKSADIDPQIFTDIIGRNFRQPKQGLGFDGSPVAHMWRTAIWPNNSL